MTAIWRTIDEIPADFGPTIATLGNFDGVHRGHQALLSEMVTEARARGVRAVAMTFDPHPLVVHRPDSPLELITGIDDKLDRLCDTGIDGVLVQEYTLGFAEQTAEEFVQAYLLDALRASRVVVGRDTKFGRGNSGDAGTMRELGERLGFEVEVIEAAHGPVSGEVRDWSSTTVRELLRAGDVSGAAAVLGRPHRLRGTIVHGDALGREIGFPTANLDVSAGMIPLHGVYAGELTVLGADREGEAPGAVGNLGADSERFLGRPLPAAVSLGFNYTVGGTDLRVEAHIIDHIGLDLYGATVALDLIDYRRPMLDFGSIEALTVALGEDVEWCRAVLEL